MISFILSRVRGVWIAVLAAVSIAYGWLIIVGLPYWGRLQAVQGGADIQTKFGYRAGEAGEALAAINEAARGDALIFYALDTPNAVLYAVSIAGVIGFGLRQFRIETSPARWLLSLPLISGGADLIENACLASALITAPGSPGILGDAAGAFTSIKFGAGFPAQLLGLLSIVLGAGAWAWRKLRPARPAA